MTADRIGILHVIHDLGYGGAQRLVTDLALNTDPQKHEVSVVSLYAPQSSPFEEELRRRNVRVLHLGKRPGLDVGTLARLGGVLRDVQPRVVHTHCHALRYVLPHVVAGSVRAAVHTVHNLAAQDAGRPLWLTSLAYKAGVVPVAIGREVAASLGDVFGIRNPTLIRNGIDVARFAGASTARAAARRELGLGDGLVFICAASLTPKKNHAMLLDAFARAADRLPGSKLLLAGAGDTRAQLAEQAARLGLGQSLRFLGTRSDMPELFAAADVFVLSSLWEGMPLSVMEAMSAGKPVVCTAVGGSREIVQDGVNGLLVASGDSAAFTDALVSMADPGRRTAFGKHAAETAAAQFGLDAMVRAYEKLYEELVSATRKSR